MANIYALAESQISGGLMAGDETCVHHPFRVFSTREGAEAHLNDAAHTRLDGGKLVEGAVVVKEYAVQGELGAQVYWPRLASDHGTQYPGFFGDRAAADAALRVCIEKNVAAGLPRDWYDGETAKYPGLVDIMPVESDAPKMEMPPASNISIAIAQDAAPANPAGADPLPGLSSEALAAAVSEVRDHDHGHRFIA